MKDLSQEQIAQAVTRIQTLREARGLSQTELGERSGVGQSTISRVESPSANYHPSREVLTKIARALGLKLTDLLEDPDVMAHEIVGYLATPLTAVVQDDKSNAELCRVVGLIRSVASGSEFVDPKFDIYWPGDHTHPIHNSSLSPAQVYLRDRSRAGTFDFIVLFCACPSYGVGQENEIAAQAGVPAIRLLPTNISRMMTGSFLKSEDIPYSGDLSLGVEFDQSALREALKAIRRIYFSHQVLYKSMNGHGFGARLRGLLEDRSGDYKKFADDLGVGIQYIQVLMDEPFSVSNPSARLLKRMACLLRVSVGYLLGEKAGEDSIYVSSKVSWYAWQRKSPDVKGQLAVEILDEWKESHELIRSNPTAASFRNPQGAMQEEDWDRIYRQRTRKGPASDTGQERLQYK
jgi:transcriptional regulator with XRE-family HTH domain